MNRSCTLIVFVICSSPMLVGAQVAQTSLAPLPKIADQYTLVGHKNLFSGYPATTTDGMIHVVVEIPAGTNAKWEVDKNDGNLKWEFKNGKPRVVKYLPYPANYGMVPQTILPEELGGDGDALDVLLLGSALPRGAVVKARLIGVLELLDGGEQDDKLLAITPGQPFGDINDLAELEREYPGVASIVQTWFANYKGLGEIEAKGLSGRKDAESVLKAAMENYRRAAAEKEPLAPK